MDRTIEQRLKFDLKLPIGVSCIELQKQGQALRMLVDIGRRGAVHIMPQPDEGDMYTSWQRLSGNALSTVRGRVIVWAARSDDFRREYAEAFSRVAATLTLA